MRSNFNCLISNESRPEVWHVKQIWSKASSVQLWLYVTVHSPVESQIQYFASSILPSKLLSYTASGEIRYPLNLMQIKSWMLFFYQIPCGSKCSLLVWFDQIICLHCWLQGSAIAPFSSCHCSTWNFCHFNRLTDLSGGSLQLFQSYNSPLPASWSNALLVYMDGSCNGWFAAVSYSIFRWLIEHCFV